MGPKPVPKSIEITAPRPSGARFFELTAPTTMIPCGLRVDSASSVGAKLVSLCVDDQEQMKQSLSAELFGEVSVRQELDLPILPEGKMLDLTFTADIKKIWIYYREPMADAKSEKTLRTGITKRSK